MAGFNYGGGPGDGTNWSSERGNEPAPGGGSQGNAGNRDNSGSGGNKGGSVSNELRTAGDARARSHGINPQIFSFYYIDGDGHILGVNPNSSVGLNGDFSVGRVDLGLAPQSLLRDKDSNDKVNDKNIYSGNYSIGAVYKGDISAARIASLEKVISENALWANSTQSGQRITQARQKTRAAKAELAMINFVREQQAAVTQAIAAAKAKAEAEARAKAEAEARAKAEAEARAKAEAEARAKAEAEARAKAEAEARAKAEAEARAKAEAEARAKAEAEARAKAEAEAQKRRQAGMERLHSPYVQATRGMSNVQSIGWAAASVGAIRPDSLLSHALIMRILNVIVELRGIASASLAGPVAATVAGLLYSKKVGVGSDIVPGRDISVMFNDNIMNLPETSELLAKWEHGQSLNMPVRGRLVMQDDGTLETQFVRNPISSEVPVVRAIQDDITGYWGYKLPAVADVPEQTILVSPADAPGVDGSTILTGPLPLPEQIVHTGGAVTVPQEATVTITPVADDIEFNDLILVFPDGSGLDPMYIVFRSPRNMPGTVTGKGQPPGDNWLSGAGQGEGAPIPSQIADKLRGREFASFDSFRRAFWGEVSQAPELINHFKESNKRNLRKGNAPFPTPSEQVGGRNRYELHHIEHIKNGGAVYDVDNIHVLTPKNHIKLHNKRNMK
ncbi:cell envelope integrity protein TolA [Erwinia sp. 9145]|uniref:cell envelope integrity protein TolA n=1 Tax=Erwinia sp. 9145 TaxID=1500895 RepID=UPI00068E5D41|nr:cell envelope integrity protein TolA [Erwinia sp. 9145]